MNDLTYAPTRLLKATAVLRRAHGDPFRLINRIPFIARSFNYSLRCAAVEVMVGVKSTKVHFGSACPLPFCGPPMSIYLM